MCGIAGLRAYGDAVVDFGLARRMSETLTHRGPDERGEWLTSTVALMHRRLSIIDLAGSPQPMATPDGRFHLTFNGEILNYRQVRAELDYPFVTDGDTEVVLAAFALGGVEGVKRLRGQFAFAVYDCSREELTLVRDRLGILPLFYSEGDGLVAFGSEIKAVVPALPSGARLAEGALHSYLRRRAVPAPGTFVDGVQKVRPGGSLRPVGTQEHHDVLVAAASAGGPQGFRQRSGRPGRPGLGRSGGRGARRRRAGGVLPQRGR